MSLLRISEVEVVTGFRVRLKLSDGSVMERDIEHLLKGPVFESIHCNPDQFRRVLIQNGTLAWPNGADLCPDALIWGGLPPKESPGPTQPA